MTMEAFVGPDQSGLFDVDDFVNLIKQLYWLDAGDQPEEFDDFADKTIVDLWEERKTAKGLVDAAKRIVAVIDEQLQKKIGPVGMARLDDYQVQVTAPAKRVVKDPMGLIEWLGEDWAEVFNFNGARVTALREIAKRRNQDPNTAIDSFFEEETGEAKLATRKLSDAPKYVQKMKHGEQRDTMEQAYAQAAEEDQDE